ncbi:transmembrane protein 150C-like [Betta splendens]|uniref:Transmembrane protein 150C-like n=1 Tax=Betta splendens TaxID=158456 RepID=A0A6P7NZD8_BETSP|nr:transmembrane protein 150C-like [Betta splendens]XP_029025382.1 transmembrane protein 150C-like [Betta splendens]
MALNCSPWVLLPPVYSICTAAGLWIAYFVALKNDKILPLTSEYRRRNGSFYAPYISNTGNFPPGSCIFSEVTNLAAFLGSFVAVLRFLQLRHTTKAWLNVVSLVAFTASCLGLTLVGNFQLMTQKTVHNFGSLMMFGLAILYCWVQSYITLKVNLMNEGKMAAIVRFLLSGSITVCTVIYFSLLSQRLHMHAARCQWASAMLLLTFLGTFAVEFRHCHFDVMFTEKHGRPISTSESLAEDAGHLPNQL